jgi:phosphocarrier protein
MITETLVIKNEVGLHARPAAQFVKLAERFKSNVRLCKDGIWVNGKSVLGILTLAAEHGSEIILEVNGPDEQAAFNELKSVFAEENT